MEHKEIERKYLVTDTSFIAMASQCHSIKQGYLSDTESGVVRIRVIDSRAFITIKSRNRGITRDEWEYEIPLKDALEMMSMCGDKIVEKVRYDVHFEGWKWEIDVFGGKHTGLILAEIELTNEDDQPVIPAFIGREVSSDPRYYNSALASSESISAE